MPRYLTQIIFTLLFLFVFQIISAQDIKDAQKLITQDTIKLQDIEINQEQTFKRIGSYSNKISLHSSEIKNLPSLMGNADLLKAFELTPSAVSSGDGNSNLYIRGGETSQNLILYNNNRLYTPGHALNIFPLFNADHISHADLILNGANGEYGDFLSSVILVGSSRAIPKKLSLNGSVGLLSSQATLQLPLGEKWGAYISGRKTYLGAIIIPVLNSFSEKKDKNDLKYDLFDSNITIVGELNNTNKLYVDAFVSGDKFKIRDKEVPIDGRLKWENLSFSGELETQLNREITLNQSIIYTGFSNTLNANQGEMTVHISSDIKDIGYKGKLSYNLFGLRVNSGAQYTYREVRAQDTDMKMHDMSYDNENLGHNTAHELAIFSTTSLYLHPRFYVEPSLRYTFYHSILERQKTNKSFHSLDIRLSARYELDENKFIKASYSFNHQYMNKITPSSIGLPTDFWLSASTHSKPQKGHIATLGYYMPLFEGAYEFVVDTYYKSMQNVTEYNQSFIDTQKLLFTEHIHSGKGRAYGLELMFKKNTGKITGWISYALAKSERKIDGINANKYYSARQDRRHNLNIVGAYKFSEKWDVSASYIYATGNTYTQPTSWYFINGTPVKEYEKYNSARMPAYNRLDLGVNFWYKKDNGINFSIFNAFMVSNPIYTFIILKKDPKTIALYQDVKRKKFFTLIPSVSWKFKF